jgi:adenylylsulfate kinase
VSGVVVWLTGLPSSGKSTLARRVRERLLAARVVACCILDGDEVRASMVPVPRYDPGSRDDFYATLARLAALLAHQGLIVIVPATANRRAYREGARALAPRFVEVHVDVPEGECARRDAKGLYAAAARGEAPEMPGSGVSYEPPLSPDIVARGGDDDLAADAIVARVAAGPRG